MKAHDLVVFVGIILLGLAFSSCSRDAAPNSSADHSKMDHNTNVNAAADPTIDHSSMGHSMESSPGAASADPDLQFIDTMIVHHQAAVDMAKLIPERTERPELKKLGTSIIAAQEKEIVEMRSWRDKWFAGKGPAINMELAGMKASTAGMDMNKLGSSTGKPFETEFIAQMIPHHEGAIVMAKGILQTSQRPEIKALANAVIKDQQAEIDQMKKWQREWQQ